MLDTTDCIDSALLGAEVPPSAYRGRATPLAFLERAVRRAPGKTAIVDESGSCTYAELDRRSRRIASALIELAAQDAAARAHDAGDGPDAASGPAASAPRPVALFMEKSSWMAAAFLGTLMAGGFYVPIDPSVPAERAQRILDTLGEGTLVVTCAESAEAARRALPGAELLDVCDLGGHDVDERALARAARALVDTDPAYVLFTSGSTGTPKGVAVSHRAICGFIGTFVDTFGIRADDVLGNQAPFDFDVSVKDLYGALAAGATIALIPRRLFSAPALLVEELRRRDVTVMVWAVAALCLVSSLHALDGAELPSVRLVMFSGEVMPAKHLARWLERLPEALFVNLYGPTEITCNCLYHVVDRTRSYEDGLPLGEAFRNRRVRAIDPTTGAPAEAGGTGELYVGGPDIALGYYADPVRTQAAFVPDPLGGSLPQTFYRTGDMVRVDEVGELFFAGRVDNQIKHQGHRIELEEIDAAFERQNGVERCRCAYDARLKRIVACYEGTADAGELRRAVARILPGPMVPQAVLRVERMPLTKNGKVDRAALLALRP